MRIAAWYITKFMLLRLKNTGLNTVNPCLEESLMCMRVSGYSWSQKPPQAFSAVSVPKMAISRHSLPALSYNPQHLPDFCARTSCIFVSP